MPNIIRIRVRDLSMASMVLAAISDTQGVELVDITEDIQVDKKPRRRRRVVPDAVKKPNYKGPRAIDIMSDWVTTQGRIFMFVELVAAMIPKGLARGTISSTLSEMVEKGLVRRVGKGRYAPRGVVIKPGDLAS